MDASSGVDHFGDLSNRFLSWLQQNGTSVSPKITLADLRDRHAGRGVIAQANIDEDEELFSIPKSSVLTFETSSVPAEFGTDLTDPWSRLILAMIYEFQLGPASRWKAYFDILPSTFETLMYWTDAELHALQGCAVVNKIGKTSANSTFMNEIIPLIRQHEAAFNTASFSDADLLALCHRMASTIMAYAFDLETTSTGKTEQEDDGWEVDSDTEDNNNGGILPKGMIPLADMLNADAARNNAKLFHSADEGGDKVVMKAIKPILRNEEIFNDYGPLPRADLLRRYGYITENYAAYDVVEVPFELIKEAAVGQELGDENFNARISYLQSTGVVDDAYDISHSIEGDEDEGEDDPFSDELKVLLNALTLSSTEFERLVKKEKLPKPALSPQALLLLQRILLRRQTLYPQDVVSAKQEINAKLANTEYRIRMAAQVIAGEKAVLSSARATVHRQLMDTGNKRKADADEASIPSASSNKKHKGDYE